ncbi:MAG: PDZ domain-containing protein [Calditrichia bacterium]
MCTLARNLLLVCLMIGGIADLYASPLSKGDALVKVKMRTDFGLPFLELTFDGGRTGLFLIDTGFDENIVDTEFAAELGLTVYNSQAVLQPGGEVEMGITEGFSFNLEEVQLEVLAARTAPLRQFRAFIGFEFQGILGHPFIARHVLYLNFKEKMMQVFSPEKHVQGNKVRVVPIDIIANEVLVPFSIKQDSGRAYFSRLKLDTGSLSGLGFALNFYEEANLEQTTPNSIATTGLGGGGTTENREFVIDLLNFAGREYRYSRAGVTIEAAGTERRTNAGTIGANILARQDLILDYPHGRILFGEEYPITAGIPDDNSGLWVIEQEGKKTVFRVYDHSPAATAGLEPGDIFIRINGVPADKLTLEDIWRLCASEPGREIVLKFKRNEETKKTVMTLQNLFR